MLGRKIYRNLAPFGLIMCSPASLGAQQCLLCDPQPEAQSDQSQPAQLRIEIKTAINFSRLAMIDNGRADVTVSTDGSEHISGSAISLGGYPAAGTVLITGEPGREIRVELPQSVNMRSSQGGTIRISDMRSTLGPAPRLDNTGKLEFSFGGKLEAQGNLSGRFRGRFPITANYE